MGGFRSIFISSFLFCESPVLGNINLFAVVFLIFLKYEMFSLASLVTIKQSLPTSLDKNTIAIDSNFIEGIH